MKAIAMQGGCDLHVESCAIGDWHVGELPDKRMRETAQQRGYLLDSRAQVFAPEFFEIFEYIFAADESILSFLLSEAKTEEQKKKVAFITEYSEQYRGLPVPDPYYGDKKSFDYVLDIIVDACKGILEHVKGNA